MQLHTIDADEQVAAVCFRLKRRGIEFLLVRTGSGRWTFPKGGAEPGLTLAQSAAVEAFEEAGVHGRIEEASFARYLYRKRRSGNSVRKAGREQLIVHAHLCEVSNAGSPQESKRKPKWFPVEKAKRQLRERRSDYDGAELARVIDLAVMRVRGLRSNRNGAMDNLQKVKFDAFDVAGTPAALQQGAIGRYIRREQTQRRDTWLSSSETRTQRLLTGKVVPLNKNKTSVT
jgi:8-oxo-dGTP pyrophosphatase MutT (NUDIX family)